MKLLGKPMYSVLACAIVGVVAILLQATDIVLADETSASDAPAAVHDLYNPARTALVNARRQLAETFRQEQDILKQRQSVHRELDESLKLLATAQRLDPSMTEQFEKLRGRIAKLESDPCASGYDGESLKDLYDKLLADFEALIEHY